MLEHLSLVLSWEQDGDIMKANCHIIAVFLVFLAGCSLSIHKDVRPITAEELKAYVSQNNIPTPVYMGDFSLMKKLYLADNNSVQFPSVLLVNSELEVVYIQRGYSSSFHEDLKEAIDCNTRFCVPNSKYVRMKPLFAGKKIDNIELVDIEGNAMNLQDLFDNNALLIIDVWTTWCKPCMKAIKDIEALKIDYKHAINTVSINHDNLVDGKSD